MGPLISSRLVVPKIVALLFEKSVEIICDFCWQNKLKTPRNHTRPNRCEARRADPQLIGESEPRERQKGAQVLCARPFCACV